MEKQYKLRVSRQDELTIVDFCEENKIKWDYSSFGEFIFYFDADLRKVRDYYNNLNKMLFHGK